MNSVASICEIRRSGWGRNTAQLLSGVIAVLLLSCLPVFSQGSNGRILGTVTDQSGGVVAGATVTVIDTARGISRALTTDDAGLYNAPNLTPGNYTVRAEAKGFEKLERPNITIEVGQEIRVDLTVLPGSQEQTVTVNEAPPLVETTNATLGGTLNNAEINDLPLNGRNYQNLLGLRPGVYLQPGGGPWTQSSNGVRPDESAWLVEGVINTEFYDFRPIAGSPSPITDAATILPIDAIQEFNLEENPKAEYGWKPGAVVNVGLKSGTNQIHGSAYGFYRSAAWDARNYFNPAPSGGSCVLGALTLCDKLPTQLKQYGATVGGPIKKDKVFFFGAFEGQNDLIGNALTSNGVPETGISNGDVTNNFAAAINALQQRGATQLCSSTVTANCLSTPSLNLAGCTGTPSTVGSYSCAGGLFPVSPDGTFISTFPNSNLSYNGVGKIDAHINDKNSLHGETIIGNYVGSGEDHAFINKVFTDDFLIKAYTVSGTWDYTPNSNLVNEVRFGYNRWGLVQANNDAGVTVPGFNTGAGVAGLPDINIGNFTQFGTQHNRPQSNTPNPYYDAQESVSYLAGKHTLKFGWEYAHIEADANVPDNGRGRINFSGGVTFPSVVVNGVTTVPGSTALEDFFDGNPSGGRILTGDATRKVIWTSNSGFVQDDWRIAPRFTFNLGLRYTYNAPLKEANNLWANFDPNSPTGLVQQGSPGVSSLWKPETKDFSPRLGFAYDVTGKGTTVVRGGFSIIYSSFSAVEWISQNALQNNSAVSLNANPTGAQFVVNGVTTSGNGNIALGASNPTPSNFDWNHVVFPGSSSGGIQCGDGRGSDPSQCSLLAVDPNLQTPYVINYSLGIQHSFGNDLSLEVGYVGTHGARLTGFSDINQPNPGAGFCLGTLTAAQLADACKSGPLTKFNQQAAFEGAPYFSKFPYFGYINEQTNDVRSNYNSLQVTLTKRLSHGVSFIAGYTFAHSLDNGSLNRFGLIPQNSANPGAEYGNADFDVRHHFTFTTTYNIPGIKGFAQLLEGWQVNGIVTLQSGQPWIVNDYNSRGVTGFSGTGDTADRWDFFGNPSDFKGSNFSIPYCSGFSVNTDGTLNSSGASCTQAASQSGGNVLTTLPSSLAAKCAAVAPDPRTLAAGGCFVSGNSVLAPQTLGTFGTLGRNIFRDSGFKNVDFSVFKNFKIREQYGIQLRAELFNLFNHPIFANPYGASANTSGGQNDPSSPNQFGGTVGTPDVNAGNPVIGSGAARDLQVGVKVTF
jgi:Carboxypeptidase regulatory-like domain